MFDKVVAWYLNMTLLQIYYRVRQWKKNKNRLIFGEVMGKSLVSCFLLTHSVEFVHIVLCGSVAERLSFWTQAQ